MSTPAVTISLSGVWLCAWDLEYVPNYQVLLSVECSTDYSSYCVYLYHSQCHYDWIQ